MDVIARINELLNERKWSVYKLAMESDLTEKSIYKWMSGKNMPTVKSLYSICEAFGVTMSEFFAERNLIEVSDEVRSLYSDWQALSEEEQSAIRALVRRKQ